MGRWIGFLIAILVGIAGGLFYGWVINPTEYVDTTPDTLRIDYQTDYVLMVAEIYQVEQDPGLAAQRLAQLGPASLSDLVIKAILFAEQIGYSDKDLALMRSLSIALQEYLPGQPAIKP